MKIVRLIIALAIVASLAACKPPAGPTDPPATVNEDVEGDSDQGDDGDESNEAAPWPDGAIVVTSKADDGPGTFRRALEAAQENDLIVLTLLYSRQMSPPPFSLQVDFPEWMQTT
jgi:hypothetical protein